MTISIWRYLHLVLALFSTAFLIVVSVTGCVLALEPILDKSKPYAIKDATSQTVANVITVVKDRYEEVISIKKDKNGFIILESDEGEFYINPFTGEKLGEIEEKREIFKFMTSLHRSLFLNSLGRAFIGITAFLLFLITISGVVLILKRQNGILQFFASIVKENVHQYFHIVFGRITLIPILILSLTGTYLTLERFKIIPEEKINLSVDYDALEETHSIGYDKFELFTQTKLEDVREIIFPLFEDVEEFYHLKLKNKELYINQFSGKIESKQNYPFVSLLSGLSFNLHTGQGSIIWSLILGISMFSIPYFMYSGFAMTLQRRKGRIKNVHKKDNSEYVILVGSENGSTRLFAKMLHEGLLKLGKTSFITDMNAYSTYKKMKQLLVLTSTYGQGEPPANATKFLQRFTQNKQQNGFAYAVVGFGSLSYPDFCKYAYEVDELIYDNNQYKRILDVHTVNNKSFESFSNWVTNWGNVVGEQIKLPKESVVSKRKATLKFKTVSKTSASDNIDETFLVELDPTKKQKYTSGDLLAVYPKGDNQERLYSMAALDNTILLSIKRHEKGVCSNYLNDLILNENIEGYIIKNKEFHFPKKAKQVVMIATGTGIAPFLGMVKNCAKKQDIHLYWGAKNEDSFAVYKDRIHTALEEERLTAYVPAYSRVGTEKVYVQHLIERDHKMVMQVLDNKGVLMICGSIAMQEEIMKILNKYSISINKKPISHYKKKNQIRIDCY